MSLYRVYRKDELVVGIWKVNETVDQLKVMLPDSLAYEPDLLKLKSEKRILEKLAVRVLLKELCGEEKRIAYLSSGKPYLVDKSAFVSFSHTSGYVAVAIHPKKEVGIDIEQYGTRVQRLFQRFVREDEIPSIKAGDEVYALLLHWSAKETMFKLMEQADVDFLEHLRIWNFQPEGSGSMDAVEYRTEKRQSFHINYETHPDYVLTYACLE